MILQMHTVTQHFKLITSKLDHTFFILIERVGEREQIETNSRPA